MALTEIELRRCEKAIAAFMSIRRPPAHLRDELDLDYRVDGRSVEIFEIRPDWKEPAIRRERPVAKATFVRAQNHWKVFWMKRDGKWHSYEGNSTVRSLEAFLDIVNRDDFGCSHHHFIEQLLCLRHFVL